jgi:hypothetical protein
MEIVETDPDLEAIIVDDALQVHLSSGLKGRTEIREIHRAQGEQ